ncbi:MAG: dipeptide epimerase [Pseudomonadota bacterium]
MSPLLSITARAVDRPLKEPFVIATHRWTSIPVVVVEARRGGAVGRGEGTPLFYRPETAARLADQARAVSDALAEGGGRGLAAQLLPPNGARCAVDAALWDLEAKERGEPVWRLAGAAEPRAVLTVNTVILGAPEAMAASAAALSQQFPLLKLKLGAEGDAERLSAIRAAAPEARLVVDANAGWRPQDLEALTPALLSARVEMVEQPLPVGEDDALEGYDGPLRLCADESFQTLEDLERCARRYAMVNVKLDKCGGLTAALAIASLAERLGVGLMVGNMMGSSLGMAPAHLFAQRCALADLDGPLHLAADEDPPLRFASGMAAPPDEALWG